MAAYDEIDEEALANEIEQELQLITRNGYPLELLQRSLLDYLLFVHRHDWQGDAEEMAEFLSQMAMGIRYPIPSLPYNLLVEICDGFNVPPTFADWPSEKLSVLADMMGGCY